MSERYVVCSLKGGLGNRMFIYTAAYIINIVYGHDIYIMHLPNTHSIIDYTPLFKAKKQLLNTEIPGKVISQINPFSIWDTSYKPQIILNEYFQYYPIIRPHEYDIRAYFNSVLSPYIKEIQSKYNTENTAFIHIRHGDYKNKSDYHYLQSIDYYTEALNIIKENEIQRYFILTDDTLWVQEQELFKEDKYILFEGNELDALALMSLCKSAAICANLEGVSCMRLAYPSRTASKKDWG